MSEHPKILVVDDEPVICQACRRVFSRQGFDVEETTHAREGLDRATEGDYSAVLLDIKMPEMDGIQFLEELRKTKPDVPVMIMTGYPSIPNAASAVRLGASDYITKPFTPEEITQTVRRVLADRAARQAAAAPSAARPEADRLAPTAERLFLDESWVRLEADGSACVGAVVAGAGKAAVQAVRLPEVGEAVFQGLPLAGLSLSEESLLVVPSPISGVVVSVNESLKDDSSVLSSDPCGAGWIACLCATRPEEEIGGCKPRRVLLVSPDETTARGQRDRMTALGCQVAVTRGSDELAGVLRDRDYGVAMLDAGALGDAGPEVLQRINAEAPSLKVVVIGSSPGARETAYRQQRIFYYAVAPFADDEIVEILHAAFRSPTRPGLRKARRKAPSESISGLRITNRNGHKVQLLVPPGLLWRSDGLGREIVERLRDRAFPITMTVANGGISPPNVLKAAAACDRVMVLLAKDMGRLPGTLVRDTKAEYVSASRENAGKVTTLAVQADSTDGWFVGSDARTTQALAEHIVRDMASY